MNPHFLKYLRNKVLFFGSKVFSQKVLGTAQRECQSTRTLPIYKALKIMDFNLIKENSHYHSVFKLLEKDKRIELVDDLEIHYLELDKLEKAIKDNNVNELTEWMIFIKEAANEGKSELIAEIRKNNEVINMAGDILDKISQDEKARAIYQQRRKWYLDRVSSEKYLLKKGREEGIREATRRLVKELILKGMDICLIMEVTKLSKEEIEKINQE